MASASQWRVAVGALASAGLLALWANVPDPPLATGALAATKQPRPATKSLQSPARVDGHASTEEAPVDLAAVVTALSDADVNVRVGAVADLSLLRDTPTESLLALVAMQDSAPAVRAEALYALATRHAESRLAAFRHALDDPDRSVRKAAISGLEELGDDASAEVLATALTDRDAAIRAAAAEALVDSEPPDHTERR